VTRAADRLRVIERLEVGPVRVERRRLIAPYAVVREGKRHETDLIYRWQEPVFGSDPAADANLASVIAAQVALNYGLFSREIAFRGPLDDADRKFLGAMAENTAREIWANKILAPNPFLVGDAVGIEPRKLAPYLRAKLVFEGDPPAATSPWSIDRRRHAVLSSGGKDSLLTWAVLNEVGLETHPVFVNESGRHWYTALNAFRHFEAQVPNSTRVWTNADRVFTWMLRHFPFVRTDFDRVRADIYPLRLWTVAVFLFGALPILRARGVGRLIIGDEHDTSIRTTTHGIPHYDGLYDQSRWFDNALTRYFQRKRWGVSQFSVIRPLSELLIEKILAERYPEVLKLQMSCHATHLDGQRALPCGKCEKCRRIVGMLRALDADPRLCGYSPEQIAHCLKELATRNVKQEKAGSEHLLAMLAAKGDLPPGSGATHPEVLQVRIDPDRSPVDAIPADLRKPVYGIFLEHAQGAVRRRGRLWSKLDLMRDPQMSHPYALERALPPPTPPAGAGPRPGAPDRRRTARRRWVLGDLTWPEARKRLKEVDLALLPIGAIEQHGPHSPLDTDAFDAEYLSLRVAERCSDPKPLVLPLIPYGVSYHHDDFAGTISVSNEALGRFVYEIGMSAAHNGITKLIIVNGHGGNAPTLQFAAQTINRDARIFACVDTGETSDVDIAKICDTPNDVHAGEIETSTTLAVRPHLVDMSKAKPSVPRFSSDYLNFSGSRAIEWYARTRRISPEGVLGDPTKATAEKGQRIWDIMVRNLVELVEHLKRMSLDEIYERRY